LAGLGNVGPQMDADRPQIGADAWRASDYPLKELTESIIGAAFEVHKELGPGFLEKVYESALVCELKTRGLRADSQVQVPVSYKGQPIGVYYADVLVEGAVICEVKAIESLAPVHESQVLHYLRATGIQVGLLVNFGSRRVQLKRLVRTK
jgi:GxxExxY protein